MNPFFRRLVMRLWQRPAVRMLPLVLLGASAAQAQFAMLPTPAVAGPARDSAAEVEKEYRIDAARHLYTAYPGRIFRGKMPPLMYSVMVVETEIDSAGHVRGVNVVRKPAADEVAPWVVSMIRGAGPFPAPARLPGASVRYVDIWLVDKSGRFQVDTLTERQR